jgi:hypothetical protein
MATKQYQEIAKIQTIDIAAINRLIATSIKESLELYKSNVSHSLSTGFDGKQFVINVIIYPFNNLSRVSIRAEIDTEKMEYKAFRPVTIGIEKNDEWDKLCHNLLDIWQDACIGNNIDYVCDSNEPISTVQ